MADLSPEPTPPPPSPPRTNAFRFKRSAETNNAPSSGPDSSRHRPHHHRRHHHRRRDPSRSRSSPRSLSPDTAFRESLFDALADDEGADYWASVYGQPIHVYPPPSNGTKSTQNADDDAAPDLEALDPEEYAAYVRRKMWEKSHGHVLKEREERAKRSEEARRIRREQDREEARAKERGSQAWESLMDEGLRHGSRRKEGRRWRQAWERYTTEWADLRAHDCIATEDGPHIKRLMLPWPTLSGREQEVDSAAVTDFFRRAPHAVAEKAGAEREFDVKAILKMERVRWHPDKIMQRFVGQRLDEETMAKVTAVFQVIDGLWSEERERR